MDEIPYESGTYYIFDRGYQMITLSGYYSRKKYPEPIRKVIYWDEEQDREFVYLTNATEITAFQVANLYKNRWQV